MPGPPNRPPEKTPEAPSTPVVPETPQQKVLRRLAPSRVALRLDLWKGAPSPELTGPYERAEHAFASGDYSSASTALDLLSVRLAEPRWPTLPEPFRRLRVPIPTPVPPHWDPEHNLAPPEREARRARRAADDQLALAIGCLAWASGHGVPTDDLSGGLEEARTLLGTEGVSAAFYERIDAFWTAVRERVPEPKSGGTRPAAHAAPAGAEEA
ncbi:MAG TPA: hypothetical protein VEK13_04330 [Thermoplasmata archaeon]|nr:hypothetical protein [Thermoplasmata archaeon]